MRILILWRRGTTDMRNTIVDHALSFQKYDTNNEYFYFNVYNGRFIEDYSWIDKTMFDMVIFHYSATALRGAEGHWGNFLQLMVSIWKDYPCKKIIIQQDDYTLTGRIWDLALGVNADKIYTIMRECDYSVLYPKSKIGNIKIKTVLTGYVEEDYLDSLFLQNHRNRKRDVVYRACKLPYEYGKHGLLKAELASCFQDKLKNSDLVCDLASTNDDNGAILGNSWFDFLASSRTVIGCLGGSGYADITGEYGNKVREYTKLHPDATYEETKAVCFPDAEENLTGMISPRIFDAAITKTCQILVGEDYQGILIPNVDYIVLNRDFSNIDQVVTKMKDVDYCEEIANTCYEHVIKSQKYTYKKFIEWIMKDIGNVDHAKGFSSDLSKYIEKMCKKNNDKVWTEILMKEGKL